MADLQTDADFRIEQLKVELGLLQAEKKFVDKKNAGKLTTGDKAKMRALRAEYRANYRGAPEAGAQPATIAGSVG